MINNLAVESDKVSIFQRLDWDNSDILGTKSWIYSIVWRPKMNSLYSLKSEIKFWLILIYEVNIIILVLFVM